MTHSSAKPEHSAPIRQQLEIALYNVATAPYTSLRLIDLTYPHWIISHVLEGDVETSTRGLRWRVHAGEVMIHPPHLPFSELAATPGTHQWLLCDLAVAPNIDLFRLHAISPIVQLHDLPAFTRTFDALQDTWHHRAPFQELQAAGLLTQLLSLLLASWQAGGSIPRSPLLQTPQDRFVDVITYMSKHLDQKLGREELAELAHLHPGSFDRAFLAVYGQSPMRMLRAMRLERACQLLESTDLSLAAIALHCGLSDAAYLSRVFRRQYGQTPGVYRESVKSTTTSYIPQLSSA
jgi:AraC-like DNA-binding protein